MIDVEQMLAPISPDAPCGPSLEYDGTFLALDQMARGKPEQQMGSTVIPGEEPDWKEVERQATELFAATKDLRIGLHLSRALLRLGGFPGFAQGLAVLLGLSDRYWDTVHPALDPDDDNDPTIRFNIIAELADAGTTLAWVKTTPLVRVRALGQFTLRDLQIATGELAPTGDGKPVDLGTIEAAFGAVDLAELRATAEGLRASAKTAAAIESLTSDRAGAATGPNLSKLRQLLDQATKAVDKRLAQRGDGAAAEGAQDGAEAAPGGAARTGGPTPLAGEISSREDVIRALDKIVDYYSRYEPSSPIPILVKRSKKLVNMSFLDIVRDIAPEALPQIQYLRGPEEEVSG